MRIIGLVGGLSYESTLFYYKYINERVNQQLGKTHSAKLILNSLNNEEVLSLVNANRMQDVTEILVNAAIVVERAGADCLLICCNSVHQVAEEVQRHIRIPLLHITDAVTNKVSETGVKRVGLIGTNFTMKETFYKRKLEERGIDVILPDQPDRNYIHQVIFSELVLGLFTTEAKRKFQRIILKLISEGAQGVILGCTEIPLLINQKDVSVPVFDTTALHADSGIDFMFGSANTREELSLWKQQM
ncbi:aspartate/glutamate racemase family protein [Paenibacillus sp. FSL H7-0442]|uniref:aspartate/glutamate racemase family protein n=1 Tax=Paenibacillus sp. FSL H7-0442 TaxID=2921435 RepID=UPI0031587527